MVLMDSPCGSYWYFASPKFLGYNDELHEQRFSDGSRDWILRSINSSVRFVRT